MAMFGFPHWQLKSTSTESGVVAPYERLPFAQTAVMGWRRSFLVLSVAAA
ncbi:hypothetical protein P6O14_003687 [Escherichia coli]|nr:hypothetical protein [Escherichia coli]